MLELPISQAVWKARCQFAGDLPMLLSLGIPVTPRFERVELMDTTSSRHSMKIRERTVRRVAEHQAQSCLQRAALDYRTPVQTRQAWNKERDIVPMFHRLTGYKIEPWVTTALPRRKN
jgi:hypothetical protein